MALASVGSLLVDAMRVYGLYVAIVVVGTALLMFAADSLGYSSYSDRPGTGWFGFHPNLSIADAGFLLSFVLFTALMSLSLLLIPALVLGTVVLRRLGVSRVLVLVVLLPAFGFATRWLLMAAGWYIAMDGTFTMVGTVLSIPFSFAVSSAAGLRVGRITVRAF